MKFSHKLILILLFTGLYLNGNISFNNPFELYRNYKTNSDIDAILSRSYTDTIKGRIINETKNDFINDIQASNKISSYDKMKIILEVTKIKINLVDFSYGNNSFLKTVNGLYRSGTKSNFIIISNKLNNTDMINTVIHELYHLKDDILIDGYKSYSSTNKLNIIDTTLTHEKLNKKIDNLLILYGGKGEISEKQKIFLHNLKINIYNYVTTNTSYITSEDEVYVRINMLRKYLYTNKMIDSLDQNLTNNDFLFLFSPKVILTDKSSLQFIELLFLMDIDISSDEKVILNVKCLNAINKIP